MDISELYQIYGSTTWLRQHWKHTIINNHIGVRPHYCLEILFLFWQFWHCRLCWMTISKRQKMLKLIWVLTPWSLFRILEAKRNPEDEEKTEHKHRKLKRSIYGFELETWRCSFFVCCRMKNYSPATVTSRSSTAHGTTRLFICCVSFEKVRFFSTSS